MKVKFDFNLPEEQEEYKMYNQARSMYSALHEIKDNIRRLYKYGHSFKDADQAVNGIYEDILGVLNENDLDL